MENRKLWYIASLVMLVLSVQASAQGIQLFAIEPFPLEITYNKTVNVIFPYPVKSVDKGSRQILAQKAKGVENILQVKAAGRDIEQTNLTVVTADGQLYSFVVDYAEQPVQLNIELIKQVAKSRGPDALLEKEPNQQYLKTTSEIVSAEPKRLKKIRDTSGKTRFSLTGLYIDEDVMFYRLRVDNRSNVSYQIENLRFFISDKKRVKRAATQQREISPLYVHDHTEIIQGKAYHDFVFALPKFTTEDAKKLSIQLMEKNGGRHLQLQIQNRTIIKARPVH